jgi:glutamine amidotransferase
MEVAIIDYGAGNVKSVAFALERLGVHPKLTKNPEQIAASDRVIFPGQGAAQSAMEKLKHHQLEQLLPRLTQPVLGICLGMQLLCAQSEEGDTQGLGIIDATVTRFNTALKVPQMGWNTIHELQGPLFTGIPDAVHMYLVHSYYVPIVAETTARAHYEIPYAVAVAKDNFFGVQFHPEKSSSWGQKVLENFIQLEA